MSYSSCKKSYSSINQFCGRVFSSRRDVSGRRTFSGVSMTAGKSHDSVETPCSVTVPGSAVLSINNLTAGYNGNTVINDFFLDVRRSDRIVICGPNGSGKTTLLKCILGIVKPFGGSIRLAEGCCAAYCKQDAPDRDFPITAREIVEMGLYGNRSAGSSADRRRLVDSAMEKTGTLKLSKRLFYSLSGGERQRVSLARCYCQQADLLLLDEPSSFLDSESRENFIEMMNNLDNNFAVIAVTHDDSIIKEQGWRVVSFGKTEPVMGAK